MSVRPPTPEIFDQWAETYAAERNPFHSVDRRALEFLLPPLQGLAVLDAGCGDGRHFDLLRELGCDSLCGVDFSAGMLARVPGRHLRHVTLQQAACDALPFADASFDLCVCSLVFGYIERPAAFLAELHRVLRPGGSLILTDLHPDTSLKRGWERSFSQDHVLVSLAWNRLPVAALRNATAQAGFVQAAELALPFAEPEEEVFAAAGRAQAWGELRQEPALYAATLKKAPAPDAMRSFVHARIAISADDAPHAALGTRDGRIEQVTSNAGAVAGADAIDLSGYLILPGLVNAHDHLEFGLFPQLRAGPYADSVAWAADIQQRFADLIAVHRSIPRETRCRFGALHNLLSGVTTVCHHNPVSQGMHDTSFPVRVAGPIRWAHSLAFDEAAVQRAAGDSEGLFVVHAGEGTSADAVEELDTLEHLGLLRASTVLVHALAAGSEFLERCAEQRVGIVLCASSNLALYDALPPSRIVADYPFAAIGTDSPLTNPGDLLDELRFVASRYPVPEDRLFRMVTTSPARMLQLGDAGTLRPGALADFIAIPDSGLAPAQALAHATWKDVHLIVRGGAVQLVSAELQPRLRQDESDTMSLLTVDGERRWIAGDWREDFALAAPVAQDGVLRVGRRSLSLA